MQDVCTGGSGDRLLVAGWMGLGPDRITLARHHRIHYPPAHRGKGGLQVARFSPAVIGQDGVMRSMNVCTLCRVLYGTTPWLAGGGGVKLEGEIEVEGKKRTKKQTGCCTHDWTRSAPHYATNYTRDLRNAFSSLDGGQAHLS